MVNKRRNSKRILPAGRCLLCSESSNKLVCAACRDDLPRPAAQCRGCAVALPAPGRCPRCLRRPPPFSAVAAFHYDYPLSRLVQRLKFRGQAGLACALGEWLLPVVADQPRPDCLLPMPLHWKRQLWRGFNQALELARPLSRELAIPINANLCRRRLPTRAQTDLSRAQRRRNVQQAFVARAGKLPEHVAIVDDVMTSGHTVAELSHTLRRAGVQTIQVWALSRAVLYRK